MTLPLWWNAFNVALVLVDHGFMPDVSEAIARANIVLEKKKEDA